MFFPPSCEAAKAPIPEPVSPELQRTVKSLTETSQLVVGAVTKFKGKSKKRRVVPCCEVGVRAPDGRAAAPEHRVLLSLRRLQRDILTAWCLCSGFGSKTRLLQMGPVSEMGFAGSRGRGSWGTGSTSGLLF